MFEYIYKRRLLFSIIFTVFSLVSIIISQTGRERVDTIAANAIREISNPVFSMLESIGSGFSGFWTHYIDLINLRQENIALTQRVEELERNNFQFGVMERKYNAIIEDLKFDRSYDLPKVYAEIILDIARGYSRMVIINKGTDDGISVNDGVISPSGAVGRVTATDSGNASVMLINDIRSQYPVVITRTGNKVMMSGTEDGKLKIYFVPRELDLKEGDIIMTSSHAGIFPGGVMVGAVSSISKEDYGLFQEGEVEPAVDFNKLERVFILKSPNKKTSDFIKLFEQSDDPVSAVPAP